MAKGRLRIAIEDFINTFGIGEKFSSFAQEKSDNIEQNVVDDNQEIIDIVQNVINDDPELGSWFGRVLGGNRPAGALTAIAFVAGSVVSIATSGFTPIADLVRYKVSARVEQARFDLATAVQIFWRNPDNLPNPLTDFKDLGWSDDRISGFATTFRPRLNENDLVRLVRLGFLSREEVVSELASRGYELNEIDKIFAATELRPSLQEMISIAVREGFDDAAATRFELDAEFPGTFGREAERLGLETSIDGTDKGWAELLWRAHWKLPSALQGFEMLHRLRPEKDGPTFEIEDMRALLKALDISPRFRPLLEAIAFRRLTRVDIRRAFRLGVLTPEQVREKYLDLGYDPENAQILSDIATADTSDSGRDLTIGVIKRAYKVRRFTKEEAVAGLVNLGFDETEADVILDLIDIDLDEDRIELEVDAVELALMEGEITESQARSQLGALRLPTTEIDFIINKILAKLRRRIKLPTEAQLEDFYEENIIDRDTYQQQLRLRGWNDTRINWLTQRLENAIQRKAEREAERARKEQERLEAREEARSFRLEKAVIDVEISELRLQIADLKVAIGTAEDDELVADMKQQIKEIKAAIAQAKLDKSQVVEERFTQ